MTRVTVSGASFPYFLSVVSIIFSTALGSTWDVLRSIKCHNMVHFDPFIFCWHHTYHVVSVQNRNFLMYRWVPSRIINPPNECHIAPFSDVFAYLFGSTCASSMTSGPVSRTHIVSSMSAYMNATGMSYVATYLFSLAFMTQDSNMDSVLTLGELVSYFILYTLCFLQSAYPRPLVFLHCF